MKIKIFITIFLVICMASRASSQRILTENESNFQFFKKISFNYLFQIGKNIPEIYMIYGQISKYPKTGISQMPKASMILTLGNVTAKKESMGEQEDLDKFLIELLQVLLGNLTFQLIRK